MTTSDVILYRANRVVQSAVVTASPAENKSIHYIEDHFEVEAVDNVPVRYRSNVFFGGRLVYSQRDIPGAAAGQGLEQFYVHQTVQGSIDRVSWAGGYESGAVKRYSYDAYGQRRELDWRNDADHSTYGEAHWIERGYTGHEMLDNVELIHMNGRVQNPLWGRMLSPDPVLADLELPQGLNPYSYVGNNPGSWTDPTGLTAEIIVIGRMCTAMCDPGDIEAFAREMQARLDEQAGRFLERVSTAMMTRLDAAAKGVQAVVSARLAAVGKVMEKQSQISYCRTAAMLGVSFGGQLAAAVPALGGFLGVDVTANPFNLQVGITVYGGGGVNVLPTAGVLASVGWGGSWGLQTNGASQGVGGIAFAGAGPGASMSIFRSASSEGGAASGGRVGSRGAEGFALGAAAIGGDYGSKTFANEGVCHE